jgi:hypothetical protein
MPLFRPTPSPPQLLKWVGKRGAEDSVSLEGLKGAVPAASAARGRAFVTVTSHVFSSDIWLGQQSDVFKMLPSNGLACVSLVAQ